MPYYTLLYRPAPYGPKDPWTNVAETATLSAAADELQSWRGPRPHHGDIARLIGHPTERLYVFDGGSGNFKKVPRPRGGAKNAGLTWLITWEGAGTSSSKMLVGSLPVSGVDRRRLALLGCDAFETVSSYVSRRKRISARVVLAVRSWARAGSSGASPEVLREIQTSLEALESNMYDPANMRTYYAERCAYFAAAVVTGKEPAYSAYAALDSAAYVMWEANDTPVERHHREMAPLVRRRIPLSVLLCAALRLPDPLPILSPDDRGSAP